MFYLIKDECAPAGYCLRIRHKAEIGSTLLDDALVHQTQKRIPTPHIPDTGLDLRRSEPPICRRRNAGPGLPREYRREHPCSSDKHAFDRRLLPTRATRDQLAPSAGLLFSLTVHKGERPGWKPIAHQPGLFLVTGSPLHLPMLTRRPSPMQALRYPREVGDIS